MERVQIKDPRGQASVIFMWGRISEHTTRSKNEGWGWQTQQETRIYCNALADAESFIKVPGELKDASNQWNKLTRSEW